MLSCLQLSATTAHWEHRLELQAPVKQNTEIHSHVEQFKLNRAVPVPTRRDLGLRTLMSDWWVLSARERFELRNGVCGLLLPGHCIKQSSTVQNERRNLGAVPRRMSSLFTYASIQDTTNASGQKVGNIFGLYPHFPQSFYGHRKTASNKKSPWVALR